MTAKPVDTLSSTSLKRVLAYLTEGNDKDDIAMLYLGKLTADEILGLEKEASDAEEAMKDL